jgi:putative addiction module component (TIGR02574 family)
MLTFNDVFQAAQALPAADQLRLIDSLWDQIPPNEWPMPDEASIAEAQRRSAACDAGTMSVAPWSDVKARARRRAGLDG